MKMSTPSHGASRGRVSSANGRHGVDGRSGTSNAAQTHPGIPRISAPDHREADRIGDLSCAGSVVRLMGKSMPLAMTVWLTGAALSIFGASRQPDRPCSPSAGFLNNFLLTSCILQSFLRSVPREFSFTANANRIQCEPTGSRDTHTPRLFSSGQQLHVVGARPVWES
jgi:hypothetical protein